MKTHRLGCPNCGAPLDLAIGDVEALCEYCATRLKFLPEDNELEVVKKREEMKHRERLAIEKQILQNRLEREEMDRWRETAAKVAIAALPVVGRSVAGAAFNSAAGSGGGCSGCGCLMLMVVLAAAGAVFWL
jgi:hypothetical protein